MTPLPLFNLQEYQFPSTFTVTLSADTTRNATFWEEVPNNVIRDRVTKITSKDQLARIQYLLMVRRNKFKVDLWFDGPRAQERRSGLQQRLAEVTDDILMQQPVYQDFR